MIIEPPAFQFVDLSVAAPVVQPKRRTKGMRSAEAASVPDSLRVSLGVPQVQRLDEAALAADAALQNFVRANPAHRFHLLHLACTLAAEDARSLKNAVLGVTLSADSLGESPIAWSMDPQRLSSVETIERKSTLGADLKFHDIGAKAESAKTSKIDVEIPYIVAYGELQATPFWQIERNKTKEIRGSFRFSMVVKSAGAAKADVSLKASVETTRWGLIIYDTAVSADPRLGVRLS